MYEVFEDKASGQYFVGAYEHRKGPGRRKLHKVGVMYEQKEFAEELAAELNSREGEKNVEKSAAPDLIHAETAAAKTEPDQETAPQRPADRVVRPNHYTWRGKEAKNLVQGFLGQEGIEHFWLGNALKYLYRYPKKNGTEDLRKAIQCLIMILSAVYGEHWKLVQEDQDEKVET